MGVVTPWEFPPRRLSYIFKIYANYEIKRIGKFFWILRVVDISRFPKTATPL